MKGNESFIRSQARSRYRFKRHVWSYITVNSILWLIWLFTSSGYYAAGGVVHHFLWPLWCMAIWGAGLIMHGIRVYLFPGVLSEDYEYARLKDRNNTAR